MQMRLRAGRVRRAGFGQKDRESIGLAAFLIGAGNMQSLCAEMNWHVLVIKPKVPAPIRSKTMTDKERDDALIAEKKKLSDVLEAITRLGTVDPWRDDLLRAAALLRGDEQPKPDRYVVALREVSAEMTTQEPLKDEFIKGDRDKDEWFQAAVAVLREHFPERPVIEVPIQVKAWAEGIGSVIPPTDEVREWIKSLPIGATDRSPRSRLHRLEM